MVGKCIIKTLRGSYGDNTKMGSREIYLQIFTNIRLVQNMINMMGTLANLVFISLKPSDYFI
jgi:hypothetical protein